MIGVGLVAGTVVGAVVTDVVAVSAGVATAASVTVKAVLAAASPSTHSTVTLYSPGSNPAVSAANDHVFAVAFPSCTMAVPDAPAAPAGADLFVGPKPTGVAVTVRWLPGAMFVVPLMVTVFPAVTLPISSTVISSAAPPPQIHAASTSAAATPANFLTFISSCLAPFSPPERIKISVPIPSTFGDKLLTFGPHSRDDRYGGSFLTEMQHVPGVDRGRVILYALSTCGWCARTKEFLADLGVGFSYVYVDLLAGEERDRIVREVERWNPRLSFPTVVIDDTKVIVGFQEGEIREAIGA